MLMIDWVTAKVPLDWDKPLNNGAFVELDALGGVVRTSDKRLMLEGSFSQKLSVRAWQEGILEISGNPAKYMQGHNLFGTDDLHLLMWETLMRLCRKLDLKPSLQNLKDWHSGNYTLSRIDINGMIPFESRQMCRSVVKALSSQAVMKHRGRGIDEGGTLYYGKTKGKKASRWSMKIYVKGDELGIHEIPKNAEDFDKREFQSWGGKLPDLISARDQLCDWADDKLRLELTLRGEELLHIGHKNAMMLTPSVIREVFANYVSRLQISEATVTDNSAFDKLPVRYLATYELWKSGRDVRSLMQRHTFMRHRKALLELLEVDIATLCDEKREAVPIRLQSVIQMNFTPAPHPEFVSRFPDLLVQKTRSSFSVDQAYNYLQAA